MANKLSLNIAKTEFMIIGSQQRLNATQNDMAIVIRERAINRVDVIKSLGVHIDSNLSWSEHINKISKKVFSTVRSSVLNHFKTALQLCSALIQPISTTAARFRMN